ncbi:hypothetical protein [Richelia sinica]|uniref:hypothetical protein n=1 Tax=Richelia sinica TaxID=1357545 RepID=UPI001682D0D2|nr:hypothetical protein [Richelia sinica]MBD2663392.1 hypothetical protein [Richelia sinica FACHB-800]
MGFPDLKTAEIEPDHSITVGPELSLSKLFLIACQYHKTHLALGCAQAIKSQLFLATHPRSSYDLMGANGY